MTDATTDFSMQIELLSGPEQGLRKALNQPQITFGRAPDNTIILNQDFLSRVHGELRLEQNQWLAICHSPNGMTVNHHSLAQNGSTPLRPGSTLRVGNQPLFTTHFTPPAVDTAAAPAAQARPKSEISRRAKLWIAISAYVGIIAVVGLVLSQLAGDDKNVTGDVAQLTDRQIAEDIRQPYEADRDAREAERHLRKARTWYRRAGSAPDGLYRTHHHYKKALAHLGARTFDTPADQLQFQAVERQLIETITTRYREAFAKLRNRQFSAAEQDLRDLATMYPGDADSRIFTNVQQQLRYAISHKSRPGFNR